MIEQLFFFCVSALIVLSLDVHSVLSHKSLRVVLDHCIAASREVHYILLCHNVSVSVYNILLVRFLSLCTNSWFLFVFDEGFLKGKKVEWAPDI